MMNAEKKITEICRFDELPDPGSRGKVAMRDGKQQEIFVVRQGDAVYGYLNRCPHTGGPLDWVPDQFLDLEGKQIQCATHAALFRISDGECIAGPCRGDRLVRVPVAVEDGMIVLREEVPGHSDTFE